MSRHRPLFRHAVVLACTGALALAACGKPQDTATSADNAAAPAPTTTGALAIANVLLIEQAECPDIRSADQCARMMDEMKAAVIENWTHRDAIAKTGGAA